MERLTANNEHSEFLRFGQFGGILQKLGLSLADFTSVKDERGATVYRPRTALTIRHSDVGGAAVLFHIKFFSDKKVTFREESITKERLVRFLYNHTWTVNTKHWLWRMQGTWTRTVTAQQKIFGEA